MNRLTAVLSAVLVGTCGVVCAQDAVQAGKTVFERDCIQCHGPGNEAVGTLQLARTRGEDKALLTERTDLVPAYIEYIVRHGLNAMPPFVPSGLTETELKALVAYLTD
ncbi:MAG: cytochrome c [Gammaproteobacteria bacterium]|nr:cytochrome c [Gammaproteobacteria bacterium]